MKIGAIKLLSEIAKGTTNQNELMKKVKIKTSQFYAMMKYLIKLEFIEKLDSKLLLKSNAKAGFIRQIVEQFDLEKILHDSNEEMLTCLIEPASIEEINKSSRLSLSTIKRTLNEFDSLGIIQRQDDKYVLDKTKEFVYIFAKLLKTEKNEIAIKQKVGANLGFEKELFKSADGLRKNMDAGEYKHVVLGLIFLKYVSDAFEERRQEIIKEKEQGADPEDKDEYLGQNIFWIPDKARWKTIQNYAKKPTIGKIIDNAMIAIEKTNSSLKGVLTKNYARPALDKQSLGKLIDLIGTIGLGDKANRSKDLLGKVYEYFLGQFAYAEGKKGGQFYTPPSIVDLNVHMIEPFKGRLYDGCCGSGGMFVQSEKFLEEHGGQISIYGQESNQTTWRLAKMNMALRGIDANIKWNSEGSFLRDEFPDLEADYIMANPPFNDSEWSGEMLRNDPRWKGFGVPPVGNANFAWLLHFNFHLAKNGLAGIVLSNGSMSSNTSGEGEIRQAIMKKDLVDCMVALPSHIFYSTPIPACLWYINRNKEASHDRPGQTLFIDAREMGVLVDKSHKELTKKEIALITKTYHAWKGEKDVGKYEDIPGFCKSATIEEIESHNFTLIPGRYVGTKNIEDSGEPISEQIKKLSEILKEEFHLSQKLEKEITKNLVRINHGS